MKRSILAALALLAGTAAVQPASAATCNGILSGSLCTLEGAEIVYEYDLNVANNPAVNLWGDPTLDGNDNLGFVPPDYKVVSENGVTDSSQLNFIFTRVYTKSGAEIASVSFTEQLDYSILNGGPTAQVDGALALITRNNADFTECNCDSDSFSVIGATGGLQFTTLMVATNPAVDFTALANDVQVTIQNAISAFTVDTASLDRATVQKKLGTLTVQVVPVPAAAWLFGSALGLLGWLRQRSARAATSAG
jgi:hypothetical protein